MHENRGKIESLKQVMNKHIKKHSDQTLNWWNDQVYDTCERRLNELT